MEGYITHDDFLKLEKKKRKKNKKIKIADDEAFKWLFEEKNNKTNNGN
jgi:cobyrinic acid a,c-diamide synthase